MDDVQSVYRILGFRLPHHAGASTSGLVDAPVSAFGDPAWLAAQVAAMARAYRCEDRGVLGVLWWYSASSVLLAPTVESLVVTGKALDPAKITVYSHPDGRMLAARSAGVCAAPGAALHAVLATGAAATSALTGARARVLWAIAADSLANRVLWAGGDPAFALDLAASVADLPAPRFVSVGGRTIVRRGSCCLIYQATGGDKCVSCPRQHPDERLRRLRAL